MGVDTFWKRVPAEAIAGRTPKELVALVPHWFDERFTVERENGVVVGTEDTGALIDALLRLGAAGGPGAAAGAVFAGSAADWDNHWMVTSLEPEAVRQVSEFLSSAPLQQWAERHRAALAAEAERLGYRRPFDDAWAAQVVSDARELADLFGTAAAGNEAMVVSVSA